MDYSQGLKRRVAKIERALGVEKGVCLRFPDGEGGYIEVPGCRTLADVLALAAINRHKEEVDETERK